MASKSKFPYVIGFGGAIGFGIATLILYGALIGDSACSIAESSDPLVTMNYTQAEIDDSCMSNKLLYHALAIVPISAFLVLYWISDRFIRSLPSYK